MRTLSRFTALVALVALPLCLAGGALGAASSCVLILLTCHSVALQSDR